MYLRLPKLPADKNQDESDEDKDADDQPD